MNTHYEDTEAQRGKPQVEHPPRRHGGTEKSSDSRARPWSTALQGANQESYDWAQNGSAPELATGETGMGGVICLLKSQP